MERAGSLYRPLWYCVDLAEIHAVRAVRWQAKQVINNDYQVSIQVIFNKCSQIVKAGVGYWVSNPDFWVGNYRPTKQTDLDKTSLHHCGRYQGTMTYSGGEIIGMVCPNLMVGRYAFGEWQNCQSPSCRSICCVRISFLSCDYQVSSVKTEREQLKEVEAFNLRVNDRIGNRKGETLLKYGDLSMVQGLISPCCQI